MYIIIVMDIFKVMELMPIPRNNYFKISFTYNVYNEGDKGKCLITKEV